MAKLLNELRSTGASAGYQHWEHSMAPGADKSLNIQKLDGMFPNLIQVGLAHALVAL